MSDLLLALFDWQLMAQVWATWNSTAAELSWSSVLTMLMGSQEPSSSTLASQISAQSAVSVLSQTSAAASRDAESSLADSSTEPSPGKAARRKPAALSKVEQRVKIVNMLHPGQLQHRKARLKVCCC